MSIDSAPIVTNPVEEDIVRETQVCYFNVQSPSNDGIQIYGI
jgi:hypothetical protein